MTLVKTTESVHFFKSSAPYIERNLRDVAKVSAHYLSPWEA